MNKRVLLVVDQAGWHIALDVVLPVGIHRFELPLHSTQLQPAERLWPLANEIVANHSPKNINEERGFIGLSLSAIAGSARRLLGG
ncbi:MAG: hypothetical protein F6K50_38775 [Moorea sp. SIO3I7]|uniref:hypothetical protein n=1 Tax=Moorena sp. SIO3I8 TaxID=2607833 RepID=UPI0013C07218|nr:hypothetical protein [Moorena sp. SIO3I8]NEO01149.1 hypothetical protein [Moorena sp. SIO3I7]NEO10665.1 hypothetical protein [Moorena sp. SIO3I8]